MSTLMLQTNLRPDDQIAPEPATLRMPPPAPRAMPHAQIGAPRVPLRSQGPRRSVAVARAALAALTLAFTVLLVWVMSRVLLAEGATAAALAGLALYAVAIGWTGMAAATALIGLFAPEAVRSPVPAGWRPQGRTAILILTCGEPPLPIVRRVRALHRSLVRAGLDGETGIFLLSDTRGPAAQFEARAFGELGGLPGVWWRQRAVNTGRKTGNLADWVTQWGGDWDYMLVLDADSRMSAGRIGAMIRRMDEEPGLGLLQAGMRLVSARTRFGALQRLSGRLGGTGFGRGLAAWAGTEGNFWGHNALIRVGAFAEAARLPELSGRAPWGGAILSHDFVEAAFLRRAGWGVEFDPDSRGSFEDGPQRLGEFHRRDRRWCQGNLQHLRLIPAPGLHPASRLHLICGVLSYLAAPVWLGLVLVVALTSAAPASVLPLIGGLTLLIVPKLVGAGLWLSRARTPKRRRLVLRASVAELALSSLLAPVLLLRQSLAVAQVAIGRDCGWTPAGNKPAQRRLRRPTQTGRSEAAAGAALAAVMALWAGPAGLVLLTPVIVPLLLAPVVLPWMERPLRAGASARPFHGRAAPVVPTPLRRRMLPARHREAA
jgi:membrane glycosyltransferase